MSVIRNGRNVKRGGNRSRWSGFGYDTGGYTLVGSHSGVAGGHVRRSRTTLGMRSRLRCGSPRNGGGSRATTSSRCRTRPRYIRRAYGASRGGGNATKSRYGSGRGGAHRPSTRGGSTTGRLCHNGRRRRGYLGRTQGGGSGGADGSGAWAARSPTIATGSGSNCGSSTSGSGRTSNTTRHGPYTRRCSDLSTAGSGKERMRVH